MNSMTNLIERAKLSDDQKRYLLYGLAATTVGFLGYFAYSFLFRKKISGDSSDDESDREEAALISKVFKEKGRD